MLPIEAILFEPVGCLAEFPPGFNLNAPDIVQVQAVEEASIYEDVIPALVELKAMGVKRVITSALSAAAIHRLIERLAPADFDGVWHRDNSGGIPLLRALEGASLAPDRTIFLTDTAEGLKAAQSASVHGILMMNDPDESRRLASHNPSGGIVSLRELPDFIRLLRIRSDPSIAPAFPPTGSLH
ncbi:MAG TPA: HAD family hydrolase [Bryobacteraceae bacterium]|nr:HAD family hydrolase [Bryobacteraceae bacterium]